METTNHAVYIFQTNNDEEGKKRREVSGVYVGIVLRRVICDEC